MIRRLLIANRGEIAVRVARAARERGIVPLGIYSEADAHAYHLRFMAESVCVGPAPAAQSYLDIETVIAAATTMRADAVHPGYGFLSERASFARAVRDAGLTFVGPSPEAIDAMGSKIEAKRRVRNHDVPTIPGYDGDDQSLARLRTEAERVGFPLMVKASAGGGGRGMRVVDSLAHFDEALDAAKREALAAFGSDAVLLERYLRDPRHIEFQILADAHGATIHLGERECSIQRRHQKIVEEAPSVALTPELRERMGAAAVRAARSVDYVNAGTAEFMLEPDGSFYFLEMNTRLQVEHPVTELVHGIDLVAWQLRIADGEALTIAQDDVRPRGWAIETRIYAEDPSNDMLPSNGTISTWDPPEGPGVRLDEGVTRGSEVGVYYDPMLAKLIVFGSDRAQAIERLKIALADFRIAGIRSNLPLLRWIVKHPAYAAGETTTQFLPRHLDEDIFKRAISTDVIVNAAGGLLARGWAPWRIGGVGIPLRLQFDDKTVSLIASKRAGDTWHITQPGTPLDGTVDVGSGARPVEREGDGFVLLDGGVPLHFSLAAAPAADATSASGGAAGNGRVSAPMPGKIIKIAVAEGEDVEARALLVVLEAMKMEHRIETSSAATVKRILVKEGQIVSSGAALMELV
ncbi:MAG: acetyl-CoA carboxylase biotin carboxylase subunit [Candidatus Eremiobacteraeota bacterium]|nr:acetyl-CoA carboxylase biotin carboxylase subunit [Candidatus Eremiobacteraeota bacterium]